MADSEPANKRRKDDETDATGDTATELERIFRSDPDRITFVTKKFTEDSDINAQFERIFRDNNESMYVRCSHKTCRAKRFADQECGQNHSNLYWFQA